MSTGKLLACCLFLFLGAIPLSAQKPQTGKASYYSDKLHGRKMSNGEPYHRDSMTCAHRKYPFGTMLRVRNPLNGKEVVVEVTDRGPFTKGRIIDLSKAAARELGFLRRGFCQVEITPLHFYEVPYRPDEEDEIPELNLEYHEIELYPVPVWQMEEQLRQKKPETFPIEGHDAGRNKE